MVESRFFLHSRHPLPQSTSSLRYWLAHHPLVADYHWDHNVWGSSWLFLILSVLGYVLAVQVVKLSLLWRRRPVPLGPIPALYNLVLLLASLLMFVGCWQSAAVEIEETRWLWQRSKTSFEWILCFPLGTRPAGRVFFWSYMFYLSKLYEFFGTFILIFQKQNPSVGHVFRNSMVVIMCFLWLQFSQSLQILTLLSSTGLYIIMYVYFFLCRVGLAPRLDNAVRYCQIAQYVVMSFASVALVGLHFKKQGCSGMGAWLFGAVLDMSSLPFILIVDKQRRQRDFCNNDESSTNNSTKQE
ncbi:hypothetical protein L7F22_063427 [Adiantum nelumboides]|nr:hypothetical protein [Adiantum nelumboides]MCO5609204.1 hypothetical protein [Adiantum nelumboides]